MTDQGLIEEALETIEMKKRTLREARWRQQQVKAGRKFYPVPKYQSRDKGKGKGGPTSGVKCYRCGGPHSTYNCPGSKKQSAQVTEEAEVAFSAVGTESSLHAEEQSMNVTVAEAISTGKGVIDCGATATLGSVAALEALDHLIQKRAGESRVFVDPSVAPTFKFGNNGTTACLSTAHVQVDCGNRTGDMSIHVHDLVDQPILVSVRALKALGAIIDFGKDEILYKNLCPYSVVPVERATNGHLLMPLSGNLLDGAHRRQKPFESLRDE